MAVTSEHGPEGTVGGTKGQKSGLLDDAGAGAADKAGAMAEEDGVATAAGHVAEGHVSSLHCMMSCSQSNEYPSDCIVVANNVPYCLN